MPHLQRQLEAQYHIVVRWGVIDPLTLSVLLYYFSLSCLYLLKAASKWETSHDATLLFEDYFLNYRHQFDSYLTV